MRLIIGKFLLEQDIRSCNSFEELSEFLNENGIAQETLECALVYLLRLSGNYLEVSESALDHFINECKREALSHTLSGRDFPF